MQKHLRKLSAFHMFCKDFSAEKKRLGKPFPQTSCLKAEGQERILHPRNRSK